MKSRRNIIPLNIRCGVTGKGAVLRSLLERSPGDCIMERIMLTGNHTDCKPRANNCLFLFVPYGRFGRYVTGG